MEADTSQDVIRRQSRHVSLAGASNVDLPAVIRVLEDISHAVDDYALIRFFDDLGEGKSLLEDQPVRSLEKRLPYSFGPPL